MRHSLKFAAIFACFCGSTALNAADEGWVQLFNGKDLTGWTMAKPAAGDAYESFTETKNADGKVIAYVGKTKAKKGKDGKEIPSQEITVWQVKDGAIVGGGPASHLFTVGGEYENFHFRAEAKINDKGNSGMYFRTQISGGFPGKGYEAQVNATHGDPVKTGSLYSSNGLDKDKSEKAKHVILNTAPHKPDEWFTQEVTAIGPKIVIQVNGKQTVDYTIPGEHFTKGHFALQAHDPGSVMTFRKVEVKEIK